MSRTTQTPIIIIRRWMEKSGPKNFEEISFAFANFECTLHSPAGAEARLEVPWCIMRWELHYFTPSTFLQLKILQDCDTNLALEFCHWNYASTWRYSRAGGEGSPVRYIDMTYRLSIYRHFWKISISISISIWSYLKISISISISIRQFQKYRYRYRYRYGDFGKYRYRYRYR